MKKSALITAVLVMTTFSAGAVLAHLGEGTGKMEKGQSYEMMAPAGGHMMGSGIMGQSSDECWMGGDMMGGHMYSWMLVGFGLIYVAVIALFFWLLLRIAKALEKIALSKEARD